MVERLPAALANATDLAPGATRDLFWDLARLAPTDDAIRTRAYYLWLAAGRPQGTADAHWYAAQAQLVAAAAALVRDGLP